MVGQQRQAQDIATLIRLHQERTGDSMRALAQRSQDRLSHAHWAKMARNEVDAFPRPETIRIMAQTLSASETAVILAFARSLGLHVDAVEDPAVPLPAGAEGLDEHKRRVLWDMVLSWLPPITERQAIRDIERQNRRRSAADPDRRAPQPPGRAADHDGRSDGSVHVPDDQ